jgi:hypothetical protein
MQPSPRSTRWSQRRMKEITRAFQSALEDPVIRGLWGCLAPFAAEAWEVPVEPLPGDLAEVQAARDALGDAANDKGAVVAALIAALRDRGPKELATVGDRLWPFIVAITESWFMGRTLLTPLSTGRLSPDNPLRRNPDGSLAFPEGWEQLPSKRRVQWLMEFDAFTTSLSPARPPGRRRTGPTSPSTRGRPRLPEDLALRVYELRERGRPPWHTIARQIYPGLVRDTCKNRSQEHC